MVPVIDPAELKSLVRSCLPGVRAFRRELHRVPEVKFREFKTAERIRARLRGLGLAPEAPLLETDTVAVLRGRAPGVNVTLRADIDALPLAEEGDRPHASTHSGVMHACGHDGHAAMLTGAAEVLGRLADRLSGSVRFVFQPAEEEGGGGRDLVRAGLLDAEPRPAAVYALHGWPGLPAGVVASRPGPMMAAADRFEIRVIGRGGHGAAPHDTVDSVVTAAQAVCALQSVVSRMINPVQPVVVSVCTIHGGETSNILPDEVRLTGTTRYFDRSLRPLLEEGMGRVLEGIARASGARVEWTYKDGYIPLANDPERTAFACATVQAYSGGKAWMDLPAPYMVAEDFAYYLEKAPGAMLFLGLGENHPRLHTPGFDFNDEVLENGILTLAALALETLAPGSRAD